MSCGGVDYGSYSSGSCGGGGSQVEYVRSGCGGGHYVTTIGYGCGARTIEVEKSSDGVWQEKSNDSHDIQTLSKKINEKRIMNE